MADCLIALGANLGNCKESFDRAAEILGNHPRISACWLSGHYLTKPIGGPAEQPEFLNAAARLQTSLSPEQLLTLLQQTEDELGRIRTERWAPRLIDLDLLLYDDRVLHTPSLTLPHPRMVFRRFVLQPAVEVAADMVHPLIGWSIARLLEHLDSEPTYVAITGAPGTGRTELARQAAGRLQATFVADVIDDVWLARVLVDPPFGGWESEQNIVRQRAGLLDVARWPASGPVVMSDFWFNQSIVNAQLFLAPQDACRWEAEWSELRERVIAAKLVVLLETPIDRVADWTQKHLGAAGAAIAAARLQPYSDSLRQRVSQVNQGPWFILDASDPKSALDEIVAAVQAMQA